MILRITSIYARYYNNNIDNIGCRDPPFQLGHPSNVFPGPFTIWPSDEEVFLMRNQQDPPFPARCSYSHFSTSTVCVCISGSSSASVLLVSFAFSHHLFFLSFPFIRPHISNGSKIWTKILLGSLNLHPSLS